MIAGEPLPRLSGPRSLSHQRGMTLSGFLFQLAIWGFLGLLAIKMGPIYFDHYLIRSTLESLEKDRGLTTKTREEILELLRRRWEVNNIENVTTENVKITRDDGNLQLHLVYDVAKPVVGNVDAVVHFDDLVIVGQKAQ